MKRFELLRLLDSLLPDDAVTVTSLTGTAKEWAALRRRGANFYGLNMGLCTPLATGVALALPDRRVIALETDGSLLLSLGSLTTLANQNPGNLIEIVFDNECYEVCDELPTATAGVTSLELLARGAGIPQTQTVATREEFEQALLPALRRNVLTFIVAKIEVGTADVEERYQTLTGTRIKEDFVQALRKPGPSTVASP